jgi:hypothetical protein
MKGSSMLKEEAIGVNLRIKCNKNCFENAVTKLSLFY